MRVKGNTFCIDTGVTYIPFYKINDKEIILLDSGRANGERKGIEELLERNNFKVSGIICSHAHIDHVGNNAYLKEKYNCVIAMPVYGALICNSTVNLKLFYSTQTLTEVTEDLGSMICETDFMISDNQDKIYLRDIEFNIFHTPGHSPDHICIVTPDNVAYLGDTLISYEVMRGVKMPYAFILRKDLESKLKLYDIKFDKYIVAHKGVYDDIKKLVTDNVNFYKYRAAKVYDAIDGVMTMEEILKAIIANFNIHINTKYKYNLIQRMLKTYVEYLNEIGAIESSIHEGFLKYSKCQKDTLNKD